MNRPLLARDDPDREPLSGNVKVTREDWLNAAMHILVRHGVERVKVMTLGEHLGVSRSSFYWYFKDRQDLLDALLEHWQNTNTAALNAQAAAPAETITGAVCNVFRCFFDRRLFDKELDFAIRDWARRSDKVRKILRASDAVRVAALAEMFARFGYEADEVTTRARTLYYMQIAYDEADLRESDEDRIRQVPFYLRGFTGKDARPQEVAALAEFVRRLRREEQDGQPG